MLKQFFRRWSLCLLQRHERHAARPVSVTALSPSLSPSLAGRTSNVRHLAIKSRKVGVHELPSSASGLPSVAVMNMARIEDDFSGIFRLAIWTRHTPRLQMSTCSFPESIESNQSINLLWRASCKVHTPGPYCSRRITSGAIQNDDPAIFPERLVMRDISSQRPKSTVQTNTNPNTS